MRNAADHTDDETKAKLRRSRRWNVVLGAVAVFLAVVVTAQLIPSQSPATDGSASAETSPGAYVEGEFVQRDPDDPMAIGAVDAPVVLTMWTDPRCPFCALVARDNLPTLVEEYVETDRVRIEFQDVAFFGDQSADAAVAAHAAGNQQMYFEYMMALYDAAPEKGHPDLPRETLIAFAEQVGVPDLDRFAADLDDPKLRAEVEASTVSAQQLGVTSVPFFVAGNTALSGAQPTENFREFLDHALASAE